MMAAETLKRGKGMKFVACPRSEYAKRFPKEETWEQKYRREKREKEARDREAAARQRETLERIYAESRAAREKEKAEALAAWAELPLLIKAWRKIHGFGGIWVAAWVFAWVYGFAGVEYGWPGSKFCVGLWCVVFVLGIAMGLVVVLFSGFRVVFASGFAFAVAAKEIWIVIAVVIGVLLLVRFV